MAITDHAVASFSHHTRYTAVQQVCRTGLMTIERVIDFPIFDLRGLPLGQSSPKGEMTYYAPRSTILQNFIRNISPFDLGRANPWAKVHQKVSWPGRLLGLPSCKISSPYVNPRSRYPLPKILRTNRKTNELEIQTVNDISPACLSACGDKNVHMVETMIQRCN